MNRNKIQAPCTILLVVVNVIVFFWLSLQGMTENGVFMLEHGAMYVPRILEADEYYRLVTSMFMHFGFSHLINNMLMLVVMGYTLEGQLGKIKFLIIYLLSGLGGNLLSAAWDILTRDYAVSAGASGAIFGIIGALLYIAIRNRGRIGNVSSRGLVFMIVLSLYYGVIGSGVDNLAHIGGLFTGFIMSVLLYRKSQSERSSRF